MIQKVAGHRHVSSLRRAQRSLTTHFGPNSVKNLKNGEKVDFLKTLCCFALWLGQVEQFIVFDKELIAVGLVYLFRCLDVNGWRCERIYYFFKGLDEAKPVRCKLFI